MMNPNESRDFCFVLCSCRTAVLTGSKVRVFSSLAKHNYTRFLFSHFHNHRMNDRGTDVSETFSALMQFWPLDQTESLAQSLTVGQWPLCPAWLFPAVSQLREYKDTQRVSQTDWLMTVCQLSVLFVSLITDSYSSLSVLLCTSECIGRD